MNTQISKPQNFRKQDNHNYKGWLNSDSFFKRAFSIYGYMMVAGLIITIPFYIIMFLIMFSSWRFLPNMTRPINGECKESIETCFMCQGTSECVSLDKWTAQGKDTSDCAMVKWDEKNKYSCSCKKNKCIQEVTHLQ